jgi:hypothetical protein
LVVWLARGLPSRVRLCSAIENIERSSINMRDKKLVGESFESNRENVASNHMRVGRQLGGEDRANGIVGQKTGVDDRRSSPSMERTEKMRSEEEVK